MLQNKMHLKCCAIIIDNERLTCDSPIVVLDAKTCDMATNSRTSRHVGMVKGGVQLAVAQLCCGTCVGGRIRLGTTGKWHARNQPTLRHVQHQDALPHVTHQVRLCNSEVLHGELEGRFKERHVPSVTMAYEQRNERDLGAGGRDGGAYEGGGGGGGAGRGRGKRTCIISLDSRLLYRYEMIYDGFDGEAEVIFALVARLCTS